MFRCRGNELSTPQMCECSVDGAFGKSGCIGNGSRTAGDVAPFVSHSLAVKVQINHKRGRLLIVPD